MSVRYLDHLPIRHKNQAVRLYVDALGDKLSPVLGNTERAFRVLARNLCLNRCLTAFYDGRLVGVLGVQTVAGGFWDPTPESMIDEYGIIGCIHRLFGLRLLQHKPGPDEWYIDGIAVDEGMRSKGIGSRLLDLLRETASAKGVRKISLEVTNRNRKAKALYERLGFVEIRRQSIRPFNLIFKFPFHTSILMMKAIS